MSGPTTVDGGSRRRRSTPKGATVDAVWRDVVSGRAMVVKHHDENGRRYLHIQARDAATAPSSDLTERERLVIGYRAYGQGLKRIAFELGVSVPTVARCLARALAKMGLSSDMELSAVLGAALRQR